MAKRVDKKPVPKPEILLEQSERRLRIILRAIVRAHPDELHRTEELRIARAANILLGRKPQRGAPSFWRDDMLEMMALMYSIEARSGHERSAESLARAVIDMPTGAETPVSEQAAIEDLSNKFIQYKLELLEAFAIDGTEGFSEFYDPIVALFDALKNAGIEIDEEVISIGSSRGR